MEMMPAEVAHIAQNVSVEKRNEVQSVLNLVFNGVSKMRQQLDAVSVADQNDKVNMKLANTIRLGVRQQRLDAEKIFDQKRAEVQAQMLSYKTEDQLWLKAKQTMQLLTKEIEETARWKEETRERWEKEQQELKAQQRMVRVEKFAPTVERYEYEFMSDDVFEVFVGGLEKTYNDRIEAERKAEEEKVERERKEAEENERIRQENERLRAEAEENERVLAEERVKAETERKRLEEKAKKEREEAEAKIRAEQREKAKLEEEIRARQEEEARLKKEAEEKEAAELKAKQAAERKAKAAPDKEKLEGLAQQLDVFQMPDVKSEEAKAILANVKTLLGKVSVFIREKNSTL